MEPGKWYLFAVAFYFTFVGRFVRELNFKRLVIDHSGYFTRTGATFDVLTTKGLQPGTKFHADNPVPIMIPNDGPVWPWLAATPWFKGD